MISSNSLFLKDLGERMLFHGPVSSFGTYTAKLWIVSDSFGTDESASSITALSTVSHY